MSDSFADLWNSSAPSQPQKPVTLSQQQPSYSQPKPKQDVFALLSQSSTPTNRGNLGNSRPGSSQNFSSTGSRPITPSLSTGGTSRPGSSLSSISTKPTATASSSTDAFNDLFSGSFGGVSSKPSSNMTIAERAALAEKQRLSSQSQPRKQPAAPQNHQWAGLDALGGGTFGAKSSSSSNQQTTDHDDWGLGDFGAPATAKPSVQQSHKTPKLGASDSLLDLGDFESQPVKKATQPSKPSPAGQPKAGTLWDMDDFTGSSSSSSPAPPQPQAEKFDSPDFDFDFGNREDRSTPIHDEDDILGDLSKPVHAVRSQSSTNGSSVSSSSVSSQRPTPQMSRSSSPPPHIIGQIVEMGFSVQQAKSALAKTETGTDVQAALDMLLGGDEPGSSPQETRRPSPPPQRRFNYDDDEDDSRAYAASRRRPQATRQASAPGEPPNPNLQDQADKILAQASEIGLSVLTKASLFWKEGREKVQKAYEERAGTGNSGVGERTNGSRNTRPKWMQEAPSHLEEDPTTPTRYDRGSFRDGDEEEGSAFRDRDEQISKPSRPQRGALQSSQPSRQAARPQPEVDLFNSGPSVPEPSEPKAYVSPFRRKKPTGDPVPSSLSSVSSSRPASAPPPAPPKPKRRLPSCQEMTLDIVRQHKTKGTEAFKLGQFSVAAEEYSKAITLLPDGHSLLVPLYTNRSLARIRCGECKDAVEDTVGALGIIARTSKSWETWNPTDEDGGWDLEGSGTGEPKGGYGVAREKGSEWNDKWGRGVDLKDGWIKAVRRRAEALEGMEKWSEARKDWETLTGAGWVDPKTRDEAVRGLGRCKKMLGDGAEGSARPATAAPPKVKPRPKPTPAPAASNNAAPSVAVKAYRAQVSAMEAEDALKHQLKDSVEAKLLVWKKGKETNLRALLASLDIILWEEVIKDMGGKPGMADLVSSGGVKKWYMKSVARVHPDKLNSSNSSVEQRMIAGGVFGTLNEAWLAFKQ